MNFSQWKCKNEKKKIHNDFKTSSRESIEKNNLLKIFSNQIAASRVSIFRSHQICFLGSCIIRDDGIIRWNIYIFWCDLSRSPRAFGIAAIHNLCIFTTNMCYLSYTSRAVAFARSENKEKYFTVERKASDVSFVNRRFRRVLVTCLLFLSDDFHYSSFPWGKNEKRFYENLIRKILAIPERFVCAPFPCFRKTFRRRFIWIPVEREMFQFKSKEKSKML